MFARVASSSMVVVLLLLVLGCGGEKPPIEGLAPFSGTVQLDGKPVAHATLTFIPTATNKEGVAGSARTGPEGKFEARSGEKQTGLKPGEYNVVISRLEKPDGTVIPPDPEKSPAQLRLEESAQEGLPPKYSDLAKTTLQVTVPAGGGTHDFELTSN